MNLLKKPQLSPGCSLDALQMCRLKPGDGLAELPGSVSLGEEQIEGCK